MTNHTSLANASLTVDKEESFLIDQLQSAKHALEIHKKEMTAMRLKQNQLEKIVVDTEQAVIDFMLQNGLLQTDRITLGETSSVDVPDVESVPEQFLRIKTTKEPNKVLIKELAPVANWYSIKKNYKLTLRG